MTNQVAQSDRMVLSRLARQAMLDHGLRPDFTPEALKELDQILKDPPGIDTSVPDLRGLLWASIDNDESRDLDQLSVAAPAGGQQIKIMVAVADVDLAVRRGSALDEQASYNTTSVYTPSVIFPMLPPQLSTGLTSLNEREDRMAMVVEYTVGENGALQNAQVYRAVVRNQARLTYKRVGAWLEGAAGIPEEISAVPGLAENLSLQDQVAQGMKNWREQQGALTLETIEAEPVLQGDTVTGLDIQLKNRATELVENFMIYANGVTARFLSAQKSPSIRRVVLAPKRWDRIVEIAREHDVTLPNHPDSKALEKFLLRQRAADPERFPDLSLAVIKLLGSGEYVAEVPGDKVPDHFSLAARDYTHSTAPNRRFTDLVTERLLKAALAGQPAPYPFDELQGLAKQCTIQEDEANKVERQMNKSAAALLLRSRIGEQFDALVTGASPKGTWVRLLDLPVEGMLVEGFEGLDVGHVVRVQLVSVDVERGFIDFKRIMIK